MRIDPNLVVTAATLDTAKPQTQAPARSRTPTKPGATQVSLSSAGAAVSAEEGASPTTTTARLDRIRELLDAGEYAVDLDKLASRIVDDDLMRAGMGRP